MRRKSLLFFLTFVTVSIVGLVIAHSNISASTDPFPEYTCIQPNVAFWKKIYTECTSLQAVLHDREDLSIIYGVIDLLDPNEHRARRINRSRIKKAKNEYKAILRKLARGELPSTSAESDVANLFGSDASLATFQEAMMNVRCQVGQKDRFREGVIRSGAYLDQIREVFRSHGLPVDLVYLPHVESSFNPKAYSKFGASGIWQFTRTTGRRFLTMSYTVDERMDPIRSSSGAALLLKSHYEKLQNWPMAITAYNHGIVGMLRAKKLKGNYERIFREYKSRIFKFASRNFYSEFLAARDAAKHFQKYFGDLTLDTAPATQEVILPGYVSLKDLAEHFNTDKDVLKNLNPSLREPVCLGQKYVPKGYALSIPVDLAISSFDSVSTLPLDMIKSHQKPSEFYRVQKGDTASVVAAMHGISLRDLIIANDLNSRATIYAGEILRLPLPCKRTDSMAEL